MKKWVSGLLAIVLALCLAPAAGLGDAAEESNKLHIITRNIGSAIDSDNLTVQAIEEATGLDIEWELKPGENYPQLCQIIIASGDYPDAMEFHSSLYPNDMQMLADDGVIMPVNDLVAEYGQNILQYRPDYTWFESTTDGLRYGIPCRYAEFMQNDYFAIRKDWLDALGLAVPETGAEFFAVLKAFDERRAELPGATEEMIPLGIWNNCITLLQSWYGSERGMIRDWNDLDGKLTYFVNMPGYKQSLKDIRALYQAGLVESEFPLMNRENFFEKFFANSYGAWYWFCDNSNPQLSAWMVQYLAAVPEAEIAVVQPFKDESGARQIKGNVDRPQIVLFKDSPNAANAVKLLNYLISDEGVDLVQMGIEGRHWNATADGGVEILPLTEEQKVELGYKSYYLICMQGYEKPERAWPADLLGEFGKLRDASVPPLVVAATPTYVDYGTALSKIVEKYESELIVGEDIDFDALFDRFVAEWNAAGGAKWSEEMDAVYQAQR